MTMQVVLNYVQSFWQNGDCLKKSRTTLVTAALITKVYLHELKRDILIWNKKNKLVFGLQFFIMLQEYYFNNRHH